MSIPNYTCAYQHYYMNSAKGEIRGDKMLFKNPTQGSQNITQYSINEIQCDYSFFNVRAPYNRFVYFQPLGPGNQPLVKEVIIPEGNYSLTDFYSQMLVLLNSMTAETGWVVTKFEMEKNTYKCHLQFMTNGDRRTEIGTFPNLIFAYGLEGGGREYARIVDQNIPGLPAGETDPFYSIALWMMGRQVPTLKNKDLMWSDYVPSYDPLSSQMYLDYYSPTVPQASFDCCLYLVSEFFNNFDTLIYEDVTDETGETDLNITGANISDIWIKIPCSYYNFGDRIWYWPRTPYGFNMVNSNQNVDIKIVDQFNRVVNMNNGNFNLHLIMYFSRETNFF